MSIRAGVVGLRMGKNHALALARLADVELVALCDIDRATADALADEIGRTAGRRPDVYTDYDRMLDDAKPDLVTIATPNRFHAAMTIAAAHSGAKAICCEKPIAVDLTEAREMVAVCAERGVRLVVNHQRRLGRDFVWMRDAIASGAIGDVYLIRGTCAGDMLSDGTHLIDSALFVAGDVDWKWTFAAHHRDDYESAATAAAAAAGSDAKSGGGFDKLGGWRFGHPVEDGMFAVVELENGVRVELLTGDLRVPGRPYHDIEVIGTRGSIWRAGDKEEQNLFIRSADGSWKPPARGADADAEPTADKIAASYALLARLLAEDRPDSDHPLGTPFAMRGFELLIGVYESARIGEIVRRPVVQERYPLAVELGLDR
ncbi:MAG: gfo/Idh/MocA family oxidoreductase [Spirochaetaceae bacterium]|nr:MAG: gfo/Idh/MocA family oxidoreductase [Spirochaetaceae bacterium]